MGTKRGYRARLDSVQGLHALIDGFRRDGLRAFLVRYARSVARECFLLMDAHRLGVEEQDADDPPVLMALARVREDIERRTPTGCDMACDGHVAPMDDGHAYFWFSHMHEACAATWEAAAGVERFDPPDDGQPGADLRRRTWARVLGRSGGPFCGLRFQLLGGQSLPALSLDMVLRHAPAFDARAAAAARLWLESGKAPAGTTASQAKERVAAALERRPGKDALSRFGHSQRLLAEEPGEKPERGHIDHADIVELDDGGVLVIAFSAGLSPDDTVFLQVGDSFFTVVQNGVQFGYVDDVPEDGMAVLRAHRPVTLVEVDRREGRGRVRARHGAVVNDIGMERSLSAAMGSWRNRGAQDRGRSRLEELREWL